MNEQFKDLNVLQMTRWINALRSGDYNQCQNVLKDGDSFCCLGVLTDLLIKDGSIKGSWYRRANEPCDFWDYLPLNLTENSMETRDNGTLDPEVLAVIGLRNDEIYLNSPSAQSAVSANDVGNFNFDEIADMLYNTYLKHDEEEELEI
jgi:hypothetical protein